MLVWNDLSICSVLQYPTMVVCEIVIVRLLLQFFVFLHDIDTVLVLNVLRCLSKVRAVYKITMSWAFPGDAIRGMILYFWVPRSPLGRKSSQIGGVVFL